MRAQGRQCLCSSAAGCLLSEVLAGHAIVNRMLLYPLWWSMWSMSKRKLSRGRSRGDKLTCRSGPSQTQLPAPARDQGQSSYH
eukprot:2937461-Amphidinium_carterae.1